MTQATHVRFTELQRDLERYIHAYNFDRPHHGGRIPADIVYGATKVKRAEPKLSAHLGDGRA